MHEALAMAATVRHSSWFDCWEWKYFLATNFTSTCKRSKTNERTNKRMSKWTLAHKYLAIEPKRFVCAQAHLNLHTVCKHTYIQKPFVWFMWHSENDFMYFPFFMFKPRNHFQKHQNLCGIVWPCLLLISYGIIYKYLPFSKLQNIPSRKTLYR